MAKSFGENKDYRETVWEHELSDNEMDNNSVG